MVEPGLVEGDGDLAEARACLTSGRLAEAETIFRCRLAKFPADVEALAGLGGLAGLSGHLALAVQYFDAALAQAPGHVLSLHNRGEALRLLGRLPEAEHSLRRAIEQDPNLSAAYVSLGKILETVLASARQRGAVAEATRLARELAIVLSNDGNLHLSAGLPEAAEGRYREAVAVDPGYAKAWSNLGNVLSIQGLAMAAEDACRRAIELEPTLAPAWNNLGNALSNQGRFAEAEACHDRALALQPDLPEARHNLESGSLLNLLYSSTATTAEVIARHCRWGESLPRGQGSPGQLKGAGERRWRVGYLSADFRRHAMLHFLEPVLEHHDRSRFEVFCYAQGAADRHTERLQGLIGQRWRNVTDLDDAELAGKIRGDGIDILVECMGHTQGTRIRALASHPAAVQLSWLGYLFPCGLPAIDGRLTDAWVDPPEAAPVLAGEPLYRIPGGMLAYRPHVRAPEPLAPPCYASGGITFGCLNNIQKLGLPVLQAWAEVLHRVPDSRLLLQTAALADPGMRGRLRGIFEAQGIEARRLAFLPAGDDFLTTYQQIDIALDPWPYGGGATTCDALWMGVPVVSLAGDRPAGRLTASILHQIGMAEWVTSSVDAYVAQAVALADAESLRLHRQGLRQRLRDSALCDEPGFVRRLEQTLLSAVSREQ